MKFKINEVLFNKLYLQAQEASDLGMTRVAAGITKALSSNGLTQEIQEDLIGDVKDNGSQYSKLKGEVYNTLWDLSSMIMSYYDLDSVDAKKLDTELKDFTDKFVELIENTLDVDPGDIGDCEESVPGEE